MSAEKLAVLAGIVISLLFSYVPGFATWYNPLDGIKKRLIMLGALLLVPLGAFGLSCATPIDGVTCNQVGAWALVQVFVTAAIVNQATFALSPKKAEPVEEFEPFEPPALSLKAGLALPGKKAPTSKYQIVANLAEVYVGRCALLNPNPTSIQATALKAEIQAALEKVTQALLGRPRLNDAEKWHIKTMIDQAWAKAYSPQ